jgi:hypothetical protein
VREYEEKVHFEEEKEHVFTDVNTIKYVHVLGHKHKRIRTYTA